MYLNYDYAISLIVLHNTNMLKLKKTTDGSAFILISPIVVFLIHNLFISKQSVVPIQTSLPYDVCIYRCFPKAAVWKMALRSALFAVAFGDMSLTKRNTSTKTFSISMERGNIYNP